MRENRWSFLRVLDLCSGIFLLIGGLVLGLSALIGIETVMATFTGVAFYRVLFLLIGVSAIYDLLMVKAIPRRWDCKIVTGAPEHVTS